MIKYIARNIIRFAILVLIQVLILNNIQFSGYINPYLYVLFILLMPFDTPKWVLLVSGFLLGLSIDAFTGTLGMHAFATTFMAFARPFVLQWFAPRDGYETGTLPRISYYGIEWFVKYSFILIIIHHFFLFYIEIFKFGGFFSTLSRVILSSIFTFLLVIISQYFVYRK